MSDFKLSAAEFQALYKRLRSEPSWGSTDRRGALNNISAATVVAAAGEVRAGRTVSLAAPVAVKAARDNPDPDVHEMTQPEAGTADAPGLSFAMDRIAMNIHGNADSHIDALYHVISDGKLYNGVSADAITPTGATELSIASGPHAESPRPSDAGGRAARDCDPVSASLDAAEREGGSRAALPQHQ